MKFFNKKAFTITELIVSIIILSFMFTIIAMFLSSSVNEMIDSDKQTKISSSIFELKTILDKSKSENYTNFQILNTGIGYPSIIFSDDNLEKGFLLGVVDKYTQKLKTTKSYGENYIGIRYLDENGLNEINLDNYKIYDLIFLEGEITSLGIIKDFVPSAYNGDDVITPILDLEFNVLNNVKRILGSSFDDINIPAINIYRYNLVF